MSIVFKRYDLALDDTMHEDSEGEYVLAQDAYDKCAVLSAEIATLKTQLKDAKAEAQHWKANHDNQVERTRLLWCREDIPVERLKAYTNVERYHKLRRWMGLNRRETWEEVCRLAAVACYGGTDDFDGYLDSMKEAD